MKEWLIKHAIEIILVLLIVLGVFLAYKTHKSGTLKPPTEVITELAAGKLLNIEIRTGWNTNAILRFDDGSVIKIPYFVVQRRSMKEGRHYIVRRSSIDGIKIILVTQTGEQK